MPKTEKARLHGKIQKLFGSQVENARKRLCGECAHWNGRCANGLLPITSNGDDCPYYRKKE